MKLDGIINSAKHQDISSQNLVTSVPMFRLTYTTTICPKTPPNSQPPYLNPTENPLSSELNRKVQMPKPNNIKKLKMNERTNIPLKVSPTLLDVTERDSVLLRSPREA